MLKKLLVIFLLFSNVSFALAYDFGNEFEGTAAAKEYGNYILNDNYDPNSAEYKQKREEYLNAKKAYIAKRTAEQKIIDDEYDAKVKRCGGNEDCIFDENNNGVGDDQEADMTPAELAETIKENKLMFDSDNQNTDINTKLDSNTNINSKSELNSNNNPVINGGETNTIGQPINTVIDEESVKIAENQQTQALNDYFSSKNDYSDAKDAYEKAEINNIQAQERYDAAYNKEADASFKASEAKDKLNDAISKENDALDDYEDAENIYNKTLAANGGDVNNPNVIAAKENLDGAADELDFAESEKESAFLTSNEANKESEEAAEELENAQFEADSAEDAYLEREKELTKAELELKEKDEIAVKAGEEAELIKAEAARNEKNGLINSTPGGSNQVSGGKGEVGGNTRRLGEETIKDSLIGISENEVLSNEENGLTLLQSIFVWIKNTLTGLILVIAVGVFLFIGIRLGLARGNPEEFKKGIIQLVYAVVGIFIVAAAWAAVTLVAGLNL